MRPCLALVLAFGFLASLSAQGGRDPSPANLEAMRRRRPEDALVLLNLAAIRAAEGRRAEVVELLEALGQAPGGLDPSDLRSLAPFHSESGYLRAVAAVRAAHPPVVKSTAAFTLGEADLRPEGMAFDVQDRMLYVGSAKGRILRVDPQGQVAEFATVSDPRYPHWVLGMKVDGKRRHLWAVVDDPKAWSDPAAGGATLQCFDLATGRRLRRVQGPAFGALNDLEVSPKGVVFTTNTSDGSLWQARPGRDRVEPFLPPGSVPEANGLALDADGHTLFVAGWHDIHRVEVRTRKASVLGAAAGVVAGNLDGLYVHRGTLVGIQNGVHPGRVLRFHLDRDRHRILRAEVLEAYHPAADGMTTGALDGDTLFFFRNNQMKAFDAEGRPRPGMVPKPITVARLPLR